MDQNFLELLLHHKWDENILELKSFIKALDVPSAEIVIQQKDRIELAKMNLMIDESKEFSLKESISGLEKNIVIKALLKYNNIQSQTSKALGLANHTVKDIIRQ
jgi:DNA-binding NtrC family response regulator